MNKSINLTPREVTGLLSGKTGLLLRALKPQPAETIEDEDFTGVLLNDQPMEFMGKKFWKYGAMWGAQPGPEFPACPWGEEGAVLVGKEAFIAGYECEDGCIIDYENEKVWYRADDNGHFEWWEDGEPLDNVPWKSAAVMPSWASRLSLRILSITVKRLGEITEEEALAAVGDAPYSEIKGMGLFNLIAIWEKEHPSLPFESTFAWCLLVERIKAK